MGESLARMEFFLLFANILHFFDLSPGSSTPLPHFTELEEGLTLGPLHYDVKFKRKVK